MTKSYKIWHWQLQNNFGDELNKFLFNQLIAPIFKGTPNRDDADTVIIGSVLNSFHSRWKLRKFFYKKMIVAGAGFRVEPDFKYFKRVLDLQIVRGKLTKEQFQKLGHDIDDNICLGDPGLLASMLLDTMPKKKYKIGIIPHFNDIQNPIVYDLYKTTPNSILINMLSDPMTILNQIAECETILGSAMHGLIVADALGIPNMWAENRFKTGPIEPQFKYHDYYSIYDIKKIEPIQFIDCYPKIDVAIKKQYQIKHVDVQNAQQKLLKKLTAIFT